MNTSTLTAKGQTTVPAEIRAKINAWPGTQFVWSVMPDGTIIVRAKARPVDALAGVLKATRPVGIKEMSL
ncbi:MAG: type II toxin-antitoxin system PrlF family antitoxin [Zoogloeaceae bacterium]|jgi:AbrB family looped-hinge helix DNA binding protein|nr:type II toxin-antitoxin system PrlF family antitoxin [Zoogloeaceae bacterium]